MIGRGAQRPEAIAPGGNDLYAGRVRLGLGKGEGPSVQGLGEKGFRRIPEGSGRAGYGYIAAEAEIARLGG